MDGRSVLSFHGTFLPMLEFIFWGTLARKQVRYSGIYKLVCLLKELKCHSAKPVTYFLLTVHNMQWS